MYNYYFKIILLENCPYSYKLDKLIKDNNISCEKININHTNKHIYKSNLIDTFPQIYLKKKNSTGNLLFGGYNDFVNFLQNFKNQNFNLDKINNFIEEKKWSKKATLRFIQLIN